MRQNEEEEALIVREVSQPKKITYRTLLRYSTKTDKLLMAIGIFAAILNGAISPFYAYVLGRMINGFSNSDPNVLVQQAGMKAIYFVIGGVISFILSLIMLSTLIIAGERQSTEIKKQYFRSILSQEVAWFELINPSKINVQFTDDMESLQAAISEKISFFLFNISTFILTFTLSFVIGWKLALVITLCMPLLAVSIVILGVITSKTNKAIQDSYVAAAAQSEQALCAIKTVKILNGEEFEVGQYQKLIKPAYNLSIKYSLIRGLAMGFVFASYIWAYGVGFWYGARLIANQTNNDFFNRIYDAGDLLTGAPILQVLIKGKNAGQNIFSIIDRVPKIISPLIPKRIDNFNGEITFENVEFTYPARPESKVLNRINLRIPPGLKVALVGESGCGKSTVLQLIERFYDCDDGQVLIGNERIDVKDVDLVEYRSQIGMVGQEPVLFAASIRENLLFGKTDATESEMIEALKKVNAWEFVEKMEKGLETYVGIGGSQLSGGQKQRIAIARAILKKPKVLLLDEATSALDRANEKLIQSTLDEVSKGITTIVIAHRLSTIQNADIIYVFEKGVIVEQGTHQELINIPNGIYKDKFKKQVNSEEVQQLVNSSNIQQSQQDDLSNVPNMNQVTQLNQQKHEIDSKSIATIDSNTILPRLFLYNKESRIQLNLGILCSIINGCIFPIFSIIYAKIVTLLVFSHRDYYTNEADWITYLDQVIVQSNYLSAIIIAIGLFCLIVFTLEGYLFTNVGESLTQKLRYETFSKLLTMPVPFYDKIENNAANLAVKLQIDCKDIQCIASSVIGFKVQSIFGFLCGITIAFIFSWRLALIAILTTPIQYLGKQWQAKYMWSSRQVKDNTNFKSALVMESVTNIKTVQSFANEKAILDTYNDQLQSQQSNSIKSGFIMGSAFGFATMQLLLLNAFVYYIGALLVSRGELSIQDMFLTIFAIQFATQGGSRDSHIASDIEKGQIAAVNVFAILDSTDEFQIETQTGSQRLTSRIDGNVEVKGITFQYPSREKKLFQDLSLSIKAGSKVAFVGPSGCGKSTIMQMLMRFYDPESGEILLDGINIKDYDIRYLRKQLAIVSQEPVLFNGTISENIRYNQQSTQQQIEEAAKQANAYDFIVQDKFEVVDQRNMDFGTGFSKLVGPKGSQISGGQKQRIAIARAILRNANILLLDEATSALDSQSEEIVQDSLNRFMQNKTSLSIAHRISTIRDSDIIYVFEDGKIVEQGDYKTLIGYKQFFYRLEQGITQ